MYNQNIENGKWVCVYSYYLMGISDICSYNEPTSYDLVGLTITTDTIDAMTAHFNVSNFDELARICKVVTFENNGGLRAYVGRKILSFRREVSYADGDLCIDFSVCGKNKRGSVLRD